MWKIQFDECNDTKQRNRLSLSDRIKAIEAYKKTPNYTKVGRMFNCSAKQIRTIVNNKEKILAARLFDPNLKTYKVKASLERRAKKVALLGRVMYEWFLRARRNPTVCLISYKLIQEVALEVKKVLNVDNFYPNNAWLLNFRQKYGITDFDMKILPTDEPGPSELDVESIVADVVEREKNDVSSVAWSDGTIVYNDDSSASNNTQPMSMSATGSRSRASDSPTDAESDDEPLSNYPKLEPIDVIEIESEDDDDDNDTENTTSKFSINNIDQALEHLKPLEDFALLKEDYRVIGLISQLEVILKTSKNK